MKPLSLSTTSTEGLVIVTNDRDVLADLFIYLDYVGSREIKRMVRNNQLPKGDSARIARLLGDSEMEQAAKDTGGAVWVDLLDELALHLGLVNYDTAGEYRGHSSVETSFQNNYVIVRQEEYEKFLKLSPLGQEQRILQVFLHKATHNEFYTSGVLGRLDPFSSWGSATGVMPSLDFPAVRQFLLQQLQQCKPGTWYSTQSLVAALKAEAPYFLIPQKIKAERWGKTAERYDNFYEGEDTWRHNDKPIAPDEPQAFERVEGRYIERFLEGLPLALRFVDVAYTTQPYQGLHPSRDQLRAFQVQERFLRLMRSEARPPKVTVQPNFDVVVESEIYPAHVMSQIKPLAERVSAPASGVGVSVITLQLKKNLVAAELVRKPDLDVVSLLKTLSGSDLPPNVLVELEEWSGHADRFTIYQDFGLLESVEPLPQVERYVEEHISPTLRLVILPERVTERLEHDALAPIVVKHQLIQFTPLPPGAISVFPKADAPKEDAAKAQAAPLHIKRQTTIKLTFPSEAAFTDFRQALADAHCVFHADVETRAILLAPAQMAVFESVAQQLASRYLVTLDDLS